jgi:hypothetical protein
LALDAFGQLGVKASTLPSPEPGRVLRRVIVVLRRVGAAALVVEGSAKSHRNPVERVLERSSRRVREVLIPLSNELPWLLTARRVSRASRDPAIVVLTSLLRPLWLKQLILGRTPIVEFVNEPLPRKEGRVPWIVPPSVAATTPQIAEGVRSFAPNSACRVIGHFPIAQITPTDEELGSDVLAAVDYLKSRGPWCLAFGLLHWKKDLRTVVRSAPKLGSGVGVLIAGHGTSDGKQQLAGWIDSAGADARVRTVLRPMSEGEREWLFANCSAVVLAQAEGIRSMSGSIADALATRKPIVAAKGTATGDLVERLQLGTTYVPGDADGLQRAIEDAVVGPSLATPDLPMLLSGPAASAWGLFDPLQWADQLLALTRQDDGRSD